MNNFRYRKPEYLEPEFTRRLTKTTNALIDKLEKASAKRRAAEEKAAKKSGGKKESKSEAEARRQKENEELIGRAIKAKEAEERKKLLDKLVKAELEKGDVPSLAKPEDILRVEKEFEKKGMINKKGKEEEEGEVGLTADGPARNTRSRSRTPGPQVVEGSGAATGTAPGTAKRRTRKA